MHQPPDFSANEYDVIASGPPLVEGIATRRRRRTLERGALPAPLAMTPDLLGRGSESQAMDSVVRPRRRTLERGALPAPLAMTPETEGSEQESRGAGAGDERHRKRTRWSTN